MFPEEANPRSRPAWTRYGVAVGSVALGWLARDALRPAVGPTALPFIFFFPAVAAAAWYGGFRPGALGAVLSAAVAAWAFIEPVYSFRIGSPGDIAALAAFLLSCLFIIGAMEAMHRSRVRALAELTERERVESRLSAIVEFSGDAILTKSLDGIIQTWNVSAQRMFGYTSKEIIGKPVTTLFPPDRLKEEDYILERLHQGQPAERLETVRVAKDGRHIPVSVRVSPLKDAGGRVVGASKIIHDISGLVAARQALMREKELLTTTLASIGDAVVVTDADGRVTFINGEAERLTGWKSPEAAGRPLPEVFHIIDEQTRQPAENPVEKVLRLGMVVGLANHTMLIRRDGMEIPIDDSAAPIRQDGGPVFGVVLVFRDFTERREAQRVLTRSKEELETLVAERTAKLTEMVNELRHVSYAMAHDMRAPLRAMNAFAGILLEVFKEDQHSENREYCQRIIVAARRLDKLIEDALHYTKATLQEMPLEPVDLSKLVRGLIETYPNLQPDKADIRIEGELPVVAGNESLLTQCFSNLLGNAVKFVAPGRRPQLEMQTEIHDSTARIWIKDNGIGIPKHAQARLFGMFQKLEHQYEGTGIGLAIVRKVVERMGGKVGVESEPGHGSRFWVELRVVSANAAKQEGLRT